MLLVVVVLFLGLAEPVLWRIRLRSSSSRLELQSDVVSECIKTPNFGLCIGFRSTNMVPPFAFVIQKK